MADEETQKIIEQQMANLPKDVVQAIGSVDYKTKLQEITRRQKLLIDQAGKLETETTLVMIGLEPLTDYLANIQREMGLNVVRAREIVMDVNENIFKPIRDSLQKMDTEMKNGEVKTEDEPEVTKFTNSNEADLNRDQILNEIENPSTISGGAQSMNFLKPNTITSTEPVAAGTVVEIRPAQALETIPGQVVKDITKDPNANIFESKMTKPTVTTQQIINAKPEIKLPEIKKKPSDGTDPYREPLM